MLPSPSQMYTSAVAHWPLLSGVGPTEHAKYQIQSVSQRAMLPVTTGRFKINLFYSGAGGAQKAAAGLGTSLGLT